VAELLHRAGDKPAVAGPEALSFWVVSSASPAPCASALLHALPHWQAAWAGQPHCTASLLLVASDAPLPGAPHRLQANLICPVLDESSLKLQFLSARCTLERLRSERQVLQQLSSVQHSQGCCLM
jgi:hypothetical protein